MAGCSVFFVNQWIRFIKYEKNKFYFGISSVFYSFLPILAIFFVYSHSQSGNRQRKKLKMNAKTNILWQRLL